MDFCENMYVDHVLDKHIDFLSRDYVAWGLFPTLTQGEACKITSV